MKRRQCVTARKGLSLYIQPLFLATVLLCLLGSAAGAITIPERLVYELTWTGIKAGTAVQEISYDGNGVKITSTARSTDWLSTFFPVDDRIESRLVRLPTAPFFGPPVNYRMKISEGSHRRDKEIQFDHAKGSALYIDHLGNERKTVDITSITYDSLSCFYFVRTLPIQVGRSVFVDMFDSKKLWNVEVQVLRRETLKLKAGVFDTVVVKPLMKSEGIFNKKGEMLIWLTNDARHLPVKMKTKVAVGSITATLVDGTY